jgi:hypothetical protein
MSKYKKKKFFHIGLFSPLLATQSFAEVSTELNFSPKNSRG